MLIKPLRSCSILVVFDVVMSPRNENAAANHSSVHDRSHLFSLEAIDMLSWHQSLFSGDCVLDLSFICLSRLSIGIDLAPNTPSRPIRVGSEGRGRHGGVRRRHGGLGVDQSSRFCSAIVLTRSLSRATSKGFLKTSLKPYSISFSGSASSSPARPMMSVAA